MSVPPPSHENAIEVFYKLKSTYEENRLEHYKKNQVKKERGKRVQKEPPPCIYCSRNVGTYFTARLIRDGTFYGRRLTATCGDNKSPCKLNIAIDINYFSQFRPELNENAALIEKYKNDIVLMKNDKVVYNMDPNALAKFTDVSEKLKNASKSFMEHSEKFKRSMSRPDTTRDEAALGDKIFKHKALVDKYISANDDEFLNEASDVYFTDIVPLTESIQKHKYSEKFMDNNKAGEYFLMQHKNTMRDTIYPKDDSREYAVRSFVGGYGGEGRKTLKHRKKNEHAKTLKKKPVAADK